MASTHHSDMDSGLLLAIERNCNGADAHTLRDYAHTDEMACFLGDEQWMNGARRQLESELINAEYQHVTRVTDMARERVYMCGTADVRLATLKSQTE